MILFDIIQSYIIKGAIILIILQAMFLLQGLLNEHTEKANLEGELSTTTFTFSSDMRQAGYNSSVTSFTIAETSKVEVWADINNDGSPDRVRYYLDLIPSSPKFYLKRTVNGGTALPAGRNFRKFYFMYFDSLGRSFGVPVHPDSLKYIKSLSIQAMMENSVMFHDDYLRSYWQAKIFPPTLNK